MSPLAPLSFRDLIWLRAARNLTEKQKYESEKAELELRIHQEQQKYYLLCDLRSIMFGTLGYGPNEQAKADEAWYNLPSMKANEVKNPKKAVGMSRKLREKMADKEES